jgi:uncharacterized protein with HEPN domain
VSRSDEERITDILEAASKLATIVASGAEYFQVDTTAQLASERLIEIIGEASNALNPNKRAEFPDIDWAMIISMRHLIAHHYHRVDYDQIWDTATVDVPALAAALRAGNSTN